MNAKIKAALRQVESAHASLLRAAKDTNPGNGRADKERQLALQAVVTKACQMREVVDLKSYPEVESACKQVDKLSELVAKLMEAQTKLRAAPSSSEEATQAQASLDHLRLSIDNVLKPLAATMESMEAMVLAAAALEGKFEELSTQVEKMEAQIKLDKERLAAIAKAVESTATVSAKRVK